MTDLSDTEPCLPSCNIFHQCHGEFDWALLGHGRIVGDAGNWKNPVHFQLSRSKVKAKDQGHLCGALSYACFQ